MGYHEILDGHVMLWAPINFYAHPRDCMDANDNSWVFTRMTGCPLTIVGIHTCHLVARSYVQLHAFWQLTTLQMDSQVIAMDSHIKTLASTKFMDFHAILWESMKICVPNTQLRTSSTIRLVRPCVKRGCQLNTHGLPRKI